MTTRRLDEEQEDEDLSDSNILRETFMIYGPLFVVIWLALCCLKKKCPKAYNLRRWAPKLQCALAQQQYGFISWSWRVYGVSDEDILNQCGMDALCLCRAACYGEKLALIGTLLSVFLLPIYRTANPEEDDTVDRVVRLTIANVPEGSNRLYAAVVASYIFYFSAWYLILKDFHWFHRNRIKFQSQPKPRNYSIFVRGVPVELRSNQALSEFYQQLFSKDSVYQSSVALNIPHLQREVAQREKVVQKLEHCLALQKVKGKTSTHREGPLGHPVDSIEYYQQQLQELNSKISSEITSIEESSVEDDVFASLQQDSFHSCQDKENGGDDEEREVFKSKLNDDGALPRSESVSRQSITQLPELTNNGDEGKKISEDTSRDTRWTAFLTSEAQAIFGARRSGQAWKAKSDENLETSSHGSQHINLPHSANPTMIRQPVWHEQHLKDLTTKAARFVGKGDDGEPMQAAFVSFTSLTETNVAIQVTQSNTPYEMVVHEAPDHEAIIWQNVGLDHKAVHLGTLQSYCLSAMFCLFYTVPISFTVSLTSVESLESRWPYLETVLEKAPWLEGLLDQIGPLLHSFCNSILPNVLKFIASFEGHVGESHLESSLFSKLSAFHVSKVLWKCKCTAPQYVRLTQMLSDLDNSKYLCGKCCF